MNNYYLSYCKYVIGGLLIITTNWVIRRKYCRDTKRYREAINQKKEEKFHNKENVLRKILTLDSNTKNLHKNLDKMSLEQILEYLKADENNYKLVFDYFQIKAYQVDQKLNCIVEFVDLDITGVNLSGPFAGLPISIKDNIVVKGYDSCVGCSFFLVNCPKPTENSVLLTVLQQLGCIPFAKTTSSQSTISIYSSNPIDGLTKNPQNPDFSAGGSSCGEGALVGGSGSILGFGSDLGGSVRIPAAFCGVVGFKPTYGRLSTCKELDLGNLLVKSTFGPLTKDVKSCVTVMRYLLNSEVMHNLDPLTPFIPFNEKFFTKKVLRIGYFTDDGSYPVMPAMERAVVETIKKLQAEGHECVWWSPPGNGREWTRLFMKSIAADGGKGIRDLLQHDSIDMALVYGAVHVDRNWFDALINKIKYRLLPSFLVDAEYREFYRKTNIPLSAKEINETLLEIETFRREITQSWISAGLDGLICPATGFTAFPLDNCAYYLPILTTTFVWNIANFPAGTVPVSKVNSDDIFKMTTDAKYSISNFMKNIVKIQKVTENLNVSVQCIALPWQEETCLNLMKIVEDVQ